MNFYRFIFFLLAEFVLRVGIARAQQNVFSVPSSDIVKAKKLFFQHEINLSSSFIQMNSAVVYGVGGNAEIGVNLNGIELDAQFNKPLLMSNSDANEPPLNPLLLVNAQKAIELDPVFKVAAGGQAGANVFAPKKLRFVYYAYANGAARLPGIETELIAGVYLADHQYFGPGDRNRLIVGASAVGFQLGIEQPIIADKLLLAADHFSGQHTIGRTAVGLDYYFDDHWVVAAGYQFRNPGSTADNSLVIQLAYVP